MYRQAANNEVGRYLQEQVAKMNDLRRKWKSRCITAWILLAFFVTTSVLLFLGIIGVFEWMKKIMNVL